MKSKISLIMQGLKKSSKKLYQNYNNKIIDIVLFGSSVKNKLRPADLDIAIILKNTKESELLSLMNELSVFFDNNVHLNFFLCETFFSNPLSKTLLKEGISLLDEQPVHAKLGFDSQTIFSFSLAKLEKSKKVLFYYALHGKKKQGGILKEFSGRAIAKTVMLIPVGLSDEFQSFLESWNVDFYRIDVLKG